MSLEELFERHHAALFRFVSRQTGDPDYAKDIVQETFMQVAQRPIPDDASARGWLFQLAHSLTRSGLRKRSRRAALLRARVHGVPTATPFSAPDERVESAEAAAAVRRALACLNDRERTILLMREEGFTHREIAEATGTTTGSIGTMFARALAKLEAALEDAWRERP